MPHGWGGQNGYIDYQNAIGFSHWPLNISKILNYIHFPQYGAEGNVLEGI
ncbi:hypothetical protein CLV51_103530 [Chitinophaga niastensis]|uniref:Uncharacterized protein n=1 Tax=Chitinophaga niastensis TaxID=536980 RepID=A0A2P8HK00_CHINA|nr:hypothetical protein CLV51_103530 [Chitinophaga niastensis]